MSLVSTKVKHTLTFKRVADKNDSPSEGFVYVHNFGTGFQELVFKDHSQADIFRKHLSVRENALSKAESIFDLWPEIDEFYVTSDGQSFIIASDAREHISTLEDKWFTEISKDNL